MAVPLDIHFFYVDSFLHSVLGSMLLFIQYCSCFPVHCIKLSVVFAWTIVVSFVSLLLTAAEWFHTTTALMCIDFCTYIYYVCDVKITCTLCVCHVLQVLGLLWTMCNIPTTVLWPSQILGLTVLLWSVQLPTHPAVLLHHYQELTGTILMEAGWK